MKIYLVPAVAAILLLGGCSSEKAAESREDQTAVTSAAKAEKMVDAAAVAESPAAPRPADMPDEITVEQLQGSWKVVSISALDATRKKAERKLKEPMEGAIVDIYPEQLRWSYMPQKSEGSDDFCEEPVSGIIIQKAARDEADAFFAPALKALNIDPATTGNPHEWMCAGGGKWGLSESSGALFLPLGRDDGLMAWHDGRILRMQRIKRAAPKAEIKPENVVVEREE